MRLRDAMDGWLHRARRRRARTRLRAAAPDSVLFVCLGNVCRSPYAARFMSTRASAGLDVGSAGFIGPGRAPPETALSVARSRGIDHSDHRSRTVTPELLEASDVAVVFDRFNVRDLRRSPGAKLGRVFWLSDFDPNWTGKRAIVDPWGKGSDDFDETFARIERCVLDMLSVLETSGDGV